MQFAQVNFVGLAQQRGGDKRGTRISGFPMRFSGLRQHIPIRRALEFVAQKADAFGCFTRFEGFIGVQIIDGTTSVGFKVGEGFVLGR